MADDEEEDPVTEEIDVYLAKSLVNNLHLFQYPTRPAAVTYDRTKCLAARVKPKQQKVMLEMSLNTTGPSYCTSKGEQFAYEVDHGVPEDKKFFKSDKMDKQVLLSSQGTMSTSQYAVGLFKDGELHLTPLNGVIQLRPSFEYLNRGKESKKTSAVDEGDSQDEEEEKPTALSVRFAKKETEQTKAHRMLSYQYMEKQLAEEQWTDMQFYGINDRKCIDEKDWLFCQEMNTEVLEFDPSPTNYIDTLVPSSESEQEGEAAPVPANAISMAHVRKLDLIDQVKTLLINGFLTNQIETLNNTTTKLWRDGEHIQFPNRFKNVSSAKLMNFSEICGLLHPPPNELAVLKCVQQHAVLVQGCWVVKSELLYPKGKASAFSAATAEILSRARDFVLFKFTQSRIVQRNDIITVCKLTVDDVNDIIKQVAKRNAAVGWEFKLPYDNDFVERFADVVKQQQAFWATKYKTLCDKFNIKRELAETKDNLKTKSTDSKVKQETNHVIDKPKANSVPDSALQMEVDLHNGYNEENATNQERESELSPENDDKLLNRLVKFVQEKLNTSTLSLAEFKKLILLHQTVMSPGDILSSGVSDALLLKAIKKCGGEEIDLKWPMTSQCPSDLNSRRIFALRKIDSALDEYRGVILDLFNGSFGIQRKTIMEKTKELLGSCPTNFEYSRLIQELGLVRKGNSWFIQGTLPTSPHK